MAKNSRTVQFFREQIPAFECIPGCHDCRRPEVLIDPRLEQEIYRYFAETRQALGVRVPSVSARAR